MRGALDIVVPAGTLPRRHGPLYHLTPCFRHINEPTAKLADRWLAEGREHRVLSQKKGKTRAQRLERRRHKRRAQYIAYWIGRLAPT